MNPEGNSGARIYLHDWQRRMIKDILGVDCVYLDMSADAVPVTKYGVRPQPDLDAKKMYLTDAQIRQMKDETGTACNFIHLDAPVIRALYKAPM